MASAAARERYARKNEAEDLRRAFAFLDRKGDGRIDSEELNAVFAALGHRPRRGEVDDLLWEVDEDCDGAVNWAEFQRLYRRCREDGGGTEPRGLFNVIEFVMHDREGAGAISLEEAMQIMYLRHGRAQLDAKLEEVFGTSDLNSGKTLPLTEFMSCLHTNQIKTLLSRVTARSYRPPGAAGGAATGGGAGGAQQASVRG
ncbi:MAG: outer dynein arm-docking complex subunit 3 [Monoraphidium minutum]|nr:MAG: outer dynein arm-docking complex subunit 3 [Monoraphidium minutum]